MNIVGLFMLMPIAITMAIAAWKGRETKKPRHRFWD